MGFGSNESIHFDKELPAWTKKHIDFVLPDKNIQYFVDGVPKKLNGI